MKPKKLTQLSSDDHPEIAYFATRHGLSTDQVHQLMDEQRPGPAGARCQVAGVSVGQHEKWS